MYYLGCFSAIPEDDKGGRARCRSPTSRRSLSMTACARNATTLRQDLHRRGADRARGGRHQREGAGAQGPDRHVRADPARDGPVPHRAHLADAVAGPVLPRRARARGCGGRDRYRPVGSARQGAWRPRIRPAGRPDPRLRPVLLPRPAARRPGRRRAGGIDAMVATPASRWRRGGGSSDSALATAVTSEHDGVYEQSRALRWTVEAFSALREALGPEVEVCVDFHQRTTPAYAIQLARELAPMRPFFIEDPVRAENPPSSPTCASTSPCPSPPASRSPASGTGGS